MTPTTTPVTGEMLATALHDGLQIAGRVREIVQGVWDGNYDTDRQAWSDLHGQAMRLLEWDVRTRATLAASPIPTKEKSDAR